MFWVWAFQGSGLSGFRLLSVWVFESLRFLGFGFSYGVGLCRILGLGFRVPLLLHGKSCLKVVNLNLVPGNLSFNTSKKRTNCSRHRIETRTVVEGCAIRDELRKSSPKNSQTSNMSRTAKYRPCQCFQHCDPLHNPIFRANLHIPP